MRRSLAVMVVSLAVSLPGSAFAALPDQHPAGSDSHEFAFTGSSESFVKMEYKKRKDKFVGSLTSDFEDTEGVLESEEDESAVCVEGREVKVYKFRKNRADVLIGTDQVHSDGTWSVKKHKVDGKYYASVGKSSTLLREYYGGIDYYVSCDPDSSRKLHL